ncbi:MAG: sulfite dehydrogenase [Burkholderiales bacterium]|nr:sulfite dehydrogenase [Burkholderiales bacterium]
MPRIGTQETRPVDSRRHFIGRAGLAALAAGLAPRPGAAQAADNLPPAVPAWTRSQGEAVNWRPYGLPADFEKGVVKIKRPSPLPTEGVSLTPLQHLHGTITPSGVVFERSHGGTPLIDPQQHRVMLHGLVKRPLLFTMDDLVRFPSQTRIHFLECSGNTSRDWRSPVSKTVQESHGLLSCCEWTGVALSTLLEEAGVQPGAAWVLAEGADASGTSRSIPLAKCLDDVLVVYAQNGEMLRPEQGYPVRLFVPGWEGNVSIKWLRRIKVGDAPFMTRQETARYTDLMPDGIAREFTWFMEAKSVITYPSGGHELRGPGFYEVSGLAWSGAGRIRRVDVSVDAGRTWRQAQLQEPVLTRALTRFRFPWRWDGAPTVLQSRAIDESGYVQPTRAQLVQLRGYNSRYHNNAIQSWGIAAGGKVSNVQV